MSFAALLCLLCPTQLAKFWPPVHSLKFALKDNNYEQKKRPKCQNNCNFFAITVFLPSPIAMFMELVLEAP